MNYLAIGLIIIIIIILYYIYYYFTNTTLTSGLQPLKDQLTVTYEKLKDPNSYTYSYQVWVYMSEPTKKSTQIFCRKSEAGSEFEVDLNGQELSLKAGNGKTTPAQIMVITAEFPIQKWTYLVINVYNLKTFEAYINGKLAKTVNVPNDKSPVPSSKTNSLYIGNSSLNGYLTKFTRLSKTIDAQTIWQNYLSGNGLTSFLSSLIPYGLNMSITKGEDIQRVVSVF